MAPPQNANAWAGSAVRVLEQNRPNKRWFMEVVLIGILTIAVDFMK